MISNVVGINGCFVNHGVMKNEINNETERDSKFRVRSDGSGKWNDDVLKIARQSNTIRNFDGFSH